LSFFEGWIHAVGNRIDDLRDLLVYRRQLRPPDMTFELRLRSSRLVSFA
jgi:hypothetical protein